MLNFNNETIDEIGYGQEKSVEQNAEQLISDGVDVTYFIELLGDISDPRDNRGKIHELSFVLAVTTMAILSGKNHVSEIRRLFATRSNGYKKFSIVRMSNRSLVHNCPEF